MANKCCLTPWGGSSKPKPKTTHDLQSAAGTERRQCRGLDDSRKDGPILSMRAHRLLICLKTLWLSAQIAGVVPVTANRSQQ